MHSIIMSIITKTIFTFFVATKLVFIFGSESPPIPKSFHARNDPRYLYNAVPYDLYDKVTYYRALVQQITPDEHSCGHRALFHALGLEYALEHARNGIPLNSSVRSLFSNIKLCKSAISKVNKAILDEDPFYDITQGTYGYQLALAGNLKFPVLKDKILPIFLHDNELEIIDSGISPDASRLNIDQFPLNFVERNKPLSDSPELFLQLSKLKRPFDIVHFPALLDKSHWVLTSVMLDYRSRPRLLAVDSCNTNLSRYSSLRTLILLLNEEMRKI